MPITVTVQSSGKKLKRVDAPKLNEILAAYPITHIMIERVSAMPGQGVTSMFNFGHSFGTIEAIASLQGCHVQTIRPSVWKRLMGLDSDKKATMAKATEIAGTNAAWKRVKDDGRAEAYLLAHVAQQLSEGTMEYEEPTYG